MHHDCKYLNFLTRDYYCVSDRRVALCGVCEDDATTTPTGQIIFDLNKSVYF